MRTIRFTKMHGAGNDYVYVNTLLYNIDHPEELAIRISRPHFGVGSDGLVLIGKAMDSSRADFSMRMFNADGSEGMMCGNACRCVGKFLYDRNITNRTSIRLETKAGVKEINLHVEGDKVDSATVDMGLAEFSDPTLFDEVAFNNLGKHLTALDRTFTGRFVSMGNPHFVIHVPDLKEIDVAKYGPVLETNKVFPDRCNIEFVQVLDDDSLRMRVWERGSGITLACGTGACAATVADILRNDSTHCRRVIMDGGTLLIAWDPDTRHVSMTGEAIEVFEGEINI